MDLSIYQNAHEFLTSARVALEANESANNLMYGLALRLERSSEGIPTPFFGSVQVEDEMVAAALMTPPHNLVVLSTDPAHSRAAFDLITRHLHGSMWSVPGVIGSSESALAFAQAWQSQTGEMYGLKIHERVYKLQAVIQPPIPKGSMRPVLDADIELAAHWLVDFQNEAISQGQISLEEARISVRQKIADLDFYFWEDTVPVALAGRNRPTPHGWSVGPVYTPVQHRRKGYATALTAELSQLLLDSGKQFVSLFTNLANPVSNSIYQKVGYLPVCDFDMYSFNRRS